MAVSVRGELLTSPKYAGLRPQLVHSVKWLVFNSMAKGGTLPA